MNFATLQFLGFYLVVMLAYWWCPSHRGRKLILLAASYYFYMSWSARLVSLILFSTLLDYGVGRAIVGTRGERRRALLGVSLVGNLGLLALFKYADFFIVSFREMAAGLGLQVSVAELRLVLPVGISFYTFQTLSYSIDVYRGHLRPSKSLLDFALFVAFFPQLVAGPIVRARSFLPQLRRKRSWKGDRFSEGLSQVLRGLGKKVIIADTVVWAVDPVFANPGAYGTAASWLAVLAFAAQIYADFSGYSDVAIGSALMLGFELPGNFDHPYLATDVRDFWRRWHISLSTWLRDYLYVGLGGSRGASWKTNRNLMVTMLLGGLWHGAAWTFVAWGGYHGILLVITRAVENRWGRGSGAGQEAGGWSDLPRIGGTFVLVCVGWVLFRAESFEGAAVLLAALAGFPSGSGADVRWSVAWGVLAVALLHLAAAFREKGRWRPLPGYAFAIHVALIIGIVAFMRGAQKDFIYFRF